MEPAAGARRNFAKRKKKAFHIKKKKTLTKLHVIQIGIRNAWNIISKL